MQFSAERPREQLFDGASKVPHRCVALSIIACVALIGFGCDDRTASSSRVANSKLSHQAENNQYFPTCDDLCALRIRALRGDPTASEDVMRFHATMNQAEREYWSRISAENGNLIGQYNYAVELSIQSESWFDCERALFWLKKVALADGHDELIGQAKGLLKDMEVYRTKLNKQDGAYCQRLFTQPPLKFFTQPPPK